MIALLLVQLAMADIPPIEIDASPISCHPSSHETEEIECVKCTVYRGSRQQCEQYEAMSFKNVCTAPGTKVSTEVLCRDRDRPKMPEPTPPPEPKGLWGCSQTAASSSPLTLLFLGLLPLLRRRQR